jgi:isocitrate/isopropylmalate dehydrogenase
MTAKRVVVIEGEDAAPEAVRPTIELINRLDVDIQWVYPTVGEEGIKKFNTPFPDEAKRAIDESDATLFGATSGVSFAVLFYLRWGKGTYANVRPARWFAGCRSPMADPGGIDFVIVRENLEDLYVGVEGDVEEIATLDLKSATAGVGISEFIPGKYALKVITERGTERVIRFAFELARRRRSQGRPGKVTCASKFNLLVQTDGLFIDVARRVASEYPDIPLEVFIVDDFARRMVACPQELDVVVLPNLYGDILSDLAAGIIGGLGLAPSGCYGDEYAYFESAHGSAPDIAGKNIINPTATMLSAAMMLDYLGFNGESQRLQEAIERVYAEGRHLTPDQGGTATTTQFTEAVATFL